MAFIQAARIRGAFRLMTSAARRTSSDRASPRIIMTAQPEMALKGSAARATRLRAADPLLCLLPALRLVSYGRPAIHLNGKDGAVTSNRKRACVSGPQTWIPASRRRRAGVKSVNGSRLWTPGAERGERRPARSDRRHDFQTAGRARRHRWPRQRCRNWSKNGCPKGSEDGAGGAPSRRQRTSKVVTSGR